MRIVRSVSFSMPPNLSSSAPPTPAHASAHRSITKNTRMLDKLHVRPLSQALVYTAAGVCAWHALHRPRAPSSEKMEIMGECSRKWMGEDGGVDFGWCRMLAGCRRRPETLWSTPTFFVPPALWLSFRDSPRPASREDVAEAAGGVAHGPAFPLPHIAPVSAPLQRCPISPQSADP